VESVKSRKITLPDGSGEIEVDAEEEFRAENRAGNADDLREQLERALEANREFLSIPNPTPPQTAAQVKALTRDCAALIRLVLGRLETID
jgi:hypothetical protein